LIAVATDSSGRTIFVSIDDREFSQIPHFPLSLEEARALAAEASGPRLIREQLVAHYSGKVALLRLTHEGHQHPVAASTAMPGEDPRLTIPPCPSEVGGPAGDDVGLTCEHPSTRQGIVVGRICNEHLTIRCDQGGTVSVRVGRRLGAQLDIGQPALVVFDETGYPSLRSRSLACSCEARTTGKIRRIELRDRECTRAEV
jgi:hypothetical protein